MVASQCVCGLGRKVGLCERGQHDFSNTSNMIKQMHKNTATNHLRCVDGGNVTSQDGRGVAQVMKSGRGVAGLWQ